MRTTQLTIVNQRGLHGRASMKFVELARRFPCEIQAGTSLEQLVDGKNILSLMLLAAAKGQQIVITAKGEAQQEAIAALTELVEAGFYEEQ